jgi:hypothetical protein
MAVRAPQAETMKPPVWPLLNNSALDSIRVDYDPKIDYLYVFLYEHPMPAVWDPRPDGDTWVGLRLVGDDDWVDEVVGIMVEHFRLHAVNEHPHWGTLLDATGEEKRAALRAFIADGAAMPGNLEENTSSS